MQEPFEHEPSEKDEEYLNNLRLENEIKKIKLSLEHGANFGSQPGDMELPPEIEGEFLDYIQQFEDEFAKQKTILVYELADSPAYRPVAEIPDDEITAELGRIMEILHEKAISIDTICDVEDRELYRFITEELFKHETNDIRIQGMTHGFIYEEFHPNHEYDIKNRCTEFVGQVLDKEREWTPKFLSLASEVRMQQATITEEQAVAQLTHFREAFSSFEVHEFTLTDIQINDDLNEAEATGTIRYSGNIEGGYETMEFEGSCSFGLMCEYEWWTINKINIPGVAF